MKRVAKQASAGYSGTPLPQKLGLKPGMRVLALDAPPNFEGLLAGAPGDLVRMSRLGAFDCALAFTMRTSALVPMFDKLAPRMADTGMIWVGWPKKASGVATDLSEDAVRHAGLAAGLVDVKVCAIDATWSGLKFVRRLRDRAKS